MAKALTEISREYEKQITAELAKRSLLDFTKYTFPAYQENWHHVYMCDELDEWIDGKYPMLILNMPPRHGKTELTSKRLPAFIFGRHPDAKIIACAYGADLARNMNRSVQRIIDSDKYQEVFPNTRLFGKSARSDRASHQGVFLRNTDEFEIVGYQGYYKSAGVGGGITGRGFTHGIIDDPIKSRKEADSAVFRASVLEWFRSDFFTRREGAASILLTMTRWNEADLAGQIQREALEGGRECRVISFPAILEEPTDNDPREVGDALWPEKFPLSELAGIKKSIGTRAWLSLYQQKPSPQGSGLFSRDWFEYVDEVPPNVTGIRYWDLAATEESGGNDPDWSVGLKLMRGPDNILYITDIRRMRGRPKDIEDLMVSTAAADGKRTPIVIEQVGAGWEYAIGHLSRNALSQYIVKADKVTSGSGNKEIRAHPVSAYAENGNIKILSANWTHAFLDELEAFPNGAHDDQVDALSGAFKYVMQSPYSAHAFAIDSPANKFDNLTPTRRNRRADPFSGIMPAGDNPFGD